MNILKSITATGKFGNYNCTQEGTIFFKNGKHKIVWAIGTDIIRVKCTIKLLLHVNLFTNKLKLTLRAVKNGCSSEEN